MSYSMPVSDNAPTPTQVSGRMPSFGSTLASEWRKFWYLPSTVRVIGIILLLTFGISIAIILFASGADVSREQDEGAYSVLFFGSSLGTLAFVFLCTGFVATEFRSGMVDHTFVATPRRMNVLWAKLIVVAGLGLVGGLLMSLVAVAIGQGMLLIGGYEPLRLDDPGLHRAVLLFTGLGMAVQGLLGALAAFIVRHNFGAWALAVGTSVLPVALADVFGDAYARTIPRWTPGAGVESIAGLTKPESAGFLPLPLAMLSIAVWLLIPGLFAVRRLLHGDAR